MLIFFVVVVSVLGGIILAALAVFFYQFYRSLQRLTAVTETAYGVLKPLSQDKLLPEFLGTMRKQSVQWADVLKALDSINRTFQEFNRRLAMGEGVQEAGPAQSVPAMGPESAFLTPTEEEMAIREEQAELRKQGIETAEENMAQPDMAMMNGANV